MFEVVILAGGLGTRLQSVVKDVPKPMAKINDKPFLFYLLKYLERNKVNKVILAVYYKKDVIIDYFGSNFNGIPIVYSIEDKPLGTGGGIKKAIVYTESEDIFVLNGDTYFDIELNDLYCFHKEKFADITLALKFMKKADRYGTVEITEDGRVTKFLEKGYSLSGLINGGIYLIKRDSFLNATKDFPKTFSFERDLLEKTFNLKIYGKAFGEYFIDIGIPEDYERFKYEFK